MSKCGNPVFPFFFIPRWSLAQLVRMELMFCNLRLNSGRTQEVLEKVRYPRPRRESNLWPQDHKRGRENRCVHSLCDPLSRWDNPTKHFAKMSSLSTIYQSTYFTEFVNGPNIFWASKVMKCLVGLKRCYAYDMWNQCQWHCQCFLQGPPQIEECIDNYYLRVSYLSTDIFFWHFAFYLFILHVNVFLFFFVSKWILIFTVRVNFRSRQFRLLL